MNDDIDEILGKLQELAYWEGCETGGLVLDLIELYEGYSIYASIAFQKALNAELLDHYTDLKGRKVEYDAENLDNQLATCVAISVNGMTTHFTTDIRVDSLEQLPTVLREYLTSIESPNTL